MTIKQQGGVFGRNPTFNNVEIDGTGTVDGGLTVNGFSYFNDRLTVTDDHVRVVRSANTSRIVVGVDATSAYLESTYSSGGTSDLRFLHDSSEIMRITANGITFNGDTAAANALDDYEEGTWTPEISADTVGDLSVSYSAQLGNYTKVGRLVTVYGIVTTSVFTHSTASGRVRLAGLPFTINQRGLGFLSYQGVTKTNYTAFNPIADGSIGTSAFVTASGSGQSASTLKITEMPSGGTVSFQFTIVYSS